MSGPLKREAPPFRAGEEVTVLFSCPHKLGLDGPSRPLTKIHEALSAKYGAEYHKISPEDLPELASLDGMGHGIGPAFDELALEKIANDLFEKKDLVFLGGGGASSDQMYFIHTQDQLADELTRFLHTEAGTLWFSSHYEFADRILAEEYPKYGAPSVGIHPYLKWRSAKEQDQSDFMIVPSDFCKSTYPEELQERIHVAEFGVSCDEFKPAAEPNQSDRLRVLFPATNPPRKGALYVLQAMSQIDPRKVQLTITGGWRQDWMPSNIFMPGWLRADAMPKMYQHSDVLLLPSLEEGQALASLEGAASGLPLIVTPNVGLPIEDGKQGFIVPIRDAKAIEKALKYFVDNPSEVVRMGKEARRFAEDRPWSKFQNRIIEILEAKSK